MAESLAPLRDALLRTVLSGVPQKDVATLLWDKREDDDGAAFSLLGGTLHEVKARQQGCMADEQACALLTYLAVLLPLNDEWDEDVQSRNDDGRPSNRVLRNASHWCSNPRIASRLLAPWVALAASMAHTRLYELQAVLLDFFRTALALVPACAFQLVRTIAANPLQVAAAQEDPGVRMLLTLSQECPHHFATAFADLIRSCMQQQPHHHVDALLGHSAHTAPDQHFFPGDSSAGDAHAAAAAAAAPGLPLPSTPLESTLLLLSVVLLHCDDECARAPGGDAATPIIGGGGGSGHPAAMLNSSSAVLDALLDALCASVPARQHVPWLSPTATASTADAVPAASPAALALCLRCLLSALPHCAAALPERVAPLTAGLCTALAACNAQQAPPSAAAAGVVDAAGRVHPAVLAALTGALRAAAEGAPPSARSGGGGGAHYTLSPVPARVSSGGGGAGAEAAAAAEVTVEHCTLPLGCCVARADAWVRDGMVMGVRLWSATPGGGGDGGMEPLTWLGTQPPRGGGGGGDGAGEGARMHVVELDVQGGECLVAIRVAFVAAACRQPPDAGPSVDMSQPAGLSAQQQQQQQPGRAESTSATAELGSVDAKPSTTSGDAASALAVSSPPLPTLVGLQLLTNMRECEWLGSTDADVAISSLHGAFNTRFGAICLCDEVVGIAVHSAAAGGGAAAAATAVADSAAAEHSQQQQQRRIVRIAATACRASRNPAVAARLLRAPAPPLLALSTRLLQTAYALFPWETLAALRARPEVAAVAAAPLSQLRVHPQLAAAAASSGSSSGAQPLWTRMAPPALERYILGLTRPVDAFSPPGAGGNAGDGDGVLYGGDDAGGSEPAAAAAADAMVQNLRALAAELAEEGRARALAELSIEGPAPHQLQGGGGGSASGASGDKHDSTAAEGAAEQQPAAAASPPGPQSPPLLLRTASGRALGLHAAAAQQLRPELLVCVRALQLRLLALAGELCHERRLRRRCECAARPASPPPPLPLPRAQPHIGPPQMQQQQQAGMGLAGATAAVGGAQWRSGSTAAAAARGAAWRAADDAHCGNAEGQQAAVEAAVAEERHRAQEKLRQLTERHRRQSAEKEAERQRWGRGMQRRLAKAMLLNDALREDNEELKDTVQRLEGRVVELTRQLAPLAAAAMVHRAREEQVEALEERTAAAEARCWTLTSELHACRAALPAAVAAAAAGLGALDAAAAPPPADEGGSTLLHRVYSAQQQQQRQSTAAPAAEAAATAEGAAAAEAAAAPPTVREELRAGAKEAPALRNGDAGAAERAEKSAGVASCSSFFSKHLCTLDICDHKRCIYIFHSDSSIRIAGRRVRALLRVRTAPGTGGAYDVRHAPRRSRTAA